LVRRNTPDPMKNLPGSNSGSPASPSPKRRSLPPTGQPAGHNRSPKKLEPMAARRRIGSSDSSAQQPSWQELYTAECRSHLHGQASLPKRSASVGSRELPSLENIVSAVPDSVPTRARVSTAETNNCKKTLAGSQHISFQRSSMLASVHAINQDLPADRHLSQALQLREETTRPDEKTLLQPIARHSERTMSQAVQVDRSLPAVFNSGSINAPSAAVPSTAVASSHFFQLGAAEVQVQNAEAPFARLRLADRGIGRVRSLSLGAG